MTTKSKQSLVKTIAPDQKVESFGRVYDFIRLNRAGALATIDEAGHPHVAIVYVIVHEDLSLYFSTRVEGRKFQNLLDRPVVSLTFFNEDDMESVQLTATAERVESLQLEQEILHKLIVYRYGEPNWPVPPVKMFEQGATNELAIIKITPFELTHASFATNESGRYKPFFQKIL